MTNRTVKCAALMLFGAIGSTALLTSSTIPSHADDCLAAPKGATPQGSHWYYHLERGTGHKCWYLGTEGQKVSHDAAPEARPSTQKKTADAAPAADTADAADETADATPEPMQPSVANARAELQKSASPPPAPPVAQRAPTPAGLTPFPSTASVPTPAPSTSSQTLGGRWPDTNAFRPTEQPMTVVQQPVAVAQNTQAEAPASDPQIQSQPTAQPQPVAVQQPAAASSFSAGQIMLCAIFVLLALAAVTAGVVYRYFGRLKVTPEPASRRDIWGERTPDDRIPSYEQMVMPDRRMRPRQAAEPVDEIEYLLRRASQREARQRHFSN